MGDNVMKPNSRSQKSIIYEHALRGQAINCEQHIRRSAAEVEDLKTHRRRAVEAALAGRPFPPADGVQSMNALRDAEDRLKTLGETLDSTNANIKSLELSPAKIAARTKKQDSLAQLTRDRLQADQRAGDLLSQFRAALMARAELSRSMRECANSLEIETDGDVLDETRFDNLLGSLPKELAETSGKWATWFLGERENTSRFIVCDEQLVVGETIYANGVYHFGDSIQLTPDEARVLLREDREQLPREYDKKLQQHVVMRVPPSVLSVEDFEAGVAKANAGHMLPQQYFFHLFTSSGWRVTPSKRYTVSVEVTSTVQHNGVRVHAGDTLEVSPQDALTLIEHGAAKHPS